MDWREKLIQNIKDCGQSLIDNAESLVNYEYLRDITITCYVNERDEAPYISVDTSIYPEKMIKRELKELKDNLKT